MKDDGKRGVDKFEKKLKNDKFNEIKLQPLCFSFQDHDAFNHGKSAILHWEDLIYEKKANGLALMLQFWKAGLIRNSSINTRLTWKCDDTDAKKCTRYLKKVNGRQAVIRPTSNPTLTNTKSIWMDLIW